MKLDSVPVTSPWKNKWKLFHRCDVIPRDITNYLNRRQNQSHIIMASALSRINAKYAELIKYLAYCYFTAR